MVIELCYPTEMAVYAERAQMLTNSQEHRPKRIGGKEETGLQQCNPHYVVCTYTIQYKQAVLTWTRCFQQFLPSFLYALSPFLLNCDCRYLTRRPEVTMRRHIDTLVLVGTVASTARVSSCLPRGVGPVTEALQLKLHAIIPPKHESNTSWCFM